MADSIVDAFAQVICSVGFSCRYCPFESDKCEDGLFVQPCLDIEVCKKMLKEHYHITTNDSNIAHERADS